jgi:hypothetical protein
MDWTQIIVTLITALGGSAGIITLYLKVRLDKAEKQNCLVKDIDARIDVQKAAKERFRMKYEDLLCRKVNGEQMNGELKEAYKEYELQSEELQRLYDERSVILRQNQK